MKDHGTEEALVELQTATAATEQPRSFYAVLERVLRTTPGFIFATLFVVKDGETLRVFTTEETLYPIGVRKPMRATSWAEQVIGRRESFLASNVGELTSAFFDHQTIIGLGCGSALSVPVVYDGCCLGSINLNHREHFYTWDHVAVVERLAPTVVPVFLDALRR